MQRSSIQLFFMFSLITLFSFSCKTPESRKENISTTAGFSAEARPVCCAYKDADRGIFYETSQCPSANPVDCCNEWKLSRPFKKMEVQSAGEFSCDFPNPEYLSNVQVCRGPTRFGRESPVVGGISDSVSGLSKLAHVWIKTSNIEMGMGPKIWSKDNETDTALQKLSDFLTARAIREKVQVAWRDHTGFSRAEGATCDQLYFCNERCVEETLKPNADLGVYTATNQCHIATVRVLRNCGCHNHCTAWLPGTNTCLKRVFPELRGFSLTDEEEL
jgi:hypothetical protein